MKFKKLASLFLTLTVLGSLTLPALAEPEIMVLPPVDDGVNQSINQNQNYSQLPNKDTSPVLTGSVITVPVGTSFEIITNAAINTKENNVGEIFTATLNQPVSVGSDIVIPAGSEVFGQITYNEDAGRVGRNALMEIKFTGIKSFSGNKIPMMGKILTKDNTGVLRGGSLKQQLVKNASSVAVTTAGGWAAGAGIGAIANGAGTGAAIGSITGGVVGLGYIIIHKGREVNLPIGTKMIVTLEQSLTVGQ